MSLSISLSMQELLEKWPKKKNQVLCKLCKSLPTFCTHSKRFRGLRHGGCAVRNKRETWQQRGSPVKTIWRPDHQGRAKQSRAPLSGNHCLPLTVPRCFAITFFHPPFSKPVLCFLYFFFFMIFSFRFFLNVKFLQTVLTVYRSTPVISADVCCRCWKEGRGLKAQVWVRVRIQHILRQGVNRKFRWRCTFAQEPNLRKLP